MILNSCCSQPPSDLSLRHLSGAMDEYLYEIIQGEIDSLMADAEVYDEFTDEQIQNPDGFVERVYNLVLDEFPDYENEDGPMQEFGWTVRKRRCIREEIKIINDCHLMHSALATSCKCIYNVRTDQDSKKFQLENRARDLQFAFDAFSGIVDKHF